MIDFKEIIAVTPSKVGKHMIACVDVDNKCDKFGKTVYPFDTYTFDEVFTRVYEYDAFFVTYGLPSTWEWVDDDNHDLGGKFVFPRLTKESARQLAGKGVDVFTICLVLDIDFPGKTLWTPERRIEIDNLLTVVRPATVIYPSKHGCRVIYKLVEPIPIDQTKLCLDVLSKEYFKAGCSWIDSQCRNFDRLFRLMYVDRENEGPSWEENYLNIATPFQKDLTVKLDAGDLDVQSVTRTSVSVPDNLPVFSPVDMPNAIPTRPDNRSFSVFYKEARKALKGRNCYSALFEDAGEKPLVAEGERDTTLQEYTGEAVSLLRLWRDYSFTPQEIFSLFYEWVSGSFEGDQDTPCWLTRVWYLIQDFWYKEDVEEAEATHNEVTAQENFLTGVRKWADEDTVELFTGTPEEGMAFMHGKLIAFSGKSYFVMNQDGKFCPVSVCKEHLPAVVRNLGMHNNFIPLQKVTMRGMTPVTPQDLIDKHGVPVSQVIGKVAEGNYVENLRDHDNRILVLKLFERKTDLVPEFNESVDEWLHMLGGERYKALTEWIGHSLAFETNPIRALSIIGPPSIGKKVFVQGLAECINTNRFSTSSDLGKFRGNLMKSPFLNINEGFPQGFQSFEAPGTAIKNLMSGDSMRVEDKYQTPIWILNPLRIIFTSNSYEILEDLVKGRDCPPSERISLEQRILNIQPDHRCAEWLAKRGGLSMTRGWIRGDGGQPSNFTVAKHFLELYRRLHGDGQAPTVKRFYMEGFPCPEIEKIFRRTSSRTSEIIELVLFLVTRPDRENGIEYLNERMYITPKRVLDASRSTSIIRRPLTNKDVVQGLKNLCVEDLEGQDEAKLRLGWIELDPAVLLDLSTDQGDLEAHKILEDHIARRTEQSVDKLRGLND